MSQQSRVVSESPRGRAEMQMGYLQGKGDSEPSECCLSQEKPRGREGTTWSDE